MDSNVQTKTPNNRRTKYILIGLLAVICVLSFQLYKDNGAKKRLITRKTFLIGKLYECRVASEKSTASLKDKKSQNAQLTKDLSAKTDDYNEIKKKYSVLQGSFDKQAAELHTLQKSADEWSNELSTLKANYDSAMSSVKAMQGKLDSTIEVCEKHKQNSQSLNTSFAQRLRELETCKKEKANLETEREVLVTNEQDLQKKVQELSQTQNIRRSVDNAGAKQSIEQLQVPISGKVPATEYVHSQSNNIPALSAKETAQSSQSTGQSSMTQSKVPKTPAKDIQVTPSLEQPIAKQTVDSDQQNKNLFQTVPPTDQKSLI